MEESLGVMGVPVMTKRNTERGIGEKWRTNLTESMAEAGKEEAIERGDFQYLQSLSWSTVMEHKHSYNLDSQSLSGKRQESYYT